MASPRKRNKKPKRRSRFAWLFKLLAAVALVAAITVGATVFFKVEQVEVVGNAHYTPQELVTQSGILKGDNLFALRRGSIANSMEGSLPYLESVEIDLKLPSGILITVEEWTAIASIETHSGNWLISVGGKLLEPGEAEGRIFITGLDVLLPKAGSFVALPQGDENKRTSLLDLLDALEEREALGRVTTIDLSATTQMEVTLDGRFTVILPLNGDYNYDFEVLDAAISHMGAQEKGTFDMTQKDYQAVFIPEELN